MNKIIATIFALAVFLNIFGSVQAQERIDPVRNEISNGVEIYFFFSETCPHCLKEKAFLEKLEKKYCEIEVKKLNITKQENATALKKLYEEYNVAEEARGYVPITFIGKVYFFGYDSDETTGKKLEDHIVLMIENNGQCPEENWQDKWPVTPVDLDRKIKIPILGDVSLGSLSPLGLSVILGALDGFNACAMVALGFLLTVLVSTGIKERVFLIGGVFILVSGIVYFLFISAWFNLFLVLQEIKFITTLVGVIIIVFSVFLLKDYFHGIICKLCELQPKHQGNIFVRIERKLFRRMEIASTSAAALPAVLLTVAGVAAGINAVELVCSFGFPLVFTKILATFELSRFSYYSYLFIYIIFYMLDDFLIFVFAVLTLKMTRVSQKYLAAIKLVSGIVLLLLGMALIFKPEILTFL